MYLLSNAPRASCLADTGALQVFIIILIILIIIILTPGLVKKNSGPVKSLSYKPCGLVDFFPEIRALLFSRFFLKGKMDDIQTCTHTSVFNA